ncbi:hypothetical protein CRV24_006944 [Beauveria bassiana]|nr:hypothetical protein CRV24_006944 [Beauveria bassiana]
MLAVQQPPRMGSSQPDSDPFLPFGYSMDQNQDGLLDAPDPAGAPLLSETDTKFLSSFFEDMSSAQYNMPSFGEGLHFSDAWFDLPPQFMGTATPRPNGKAKESSPGARRPFGPPMGHLRHQPMDEFKEESQRDLENEADSNTFTDWMFGSKDRHASRQAQINELHWGSDASFGNVQGYVPAPNKETVDGHHKVQMQVLGCLEPSTSVSNTRTGSPTVDPQRVAPPQPMAPTEDADAPPRKRRKSRLQRSGFDDDDDEDSKVAFKKSKSPHGSNGLPSPPAESGSRRRKSAINKGPRENLSETQKRENHIRSEQKRRTLIKEGFDDLCELVPGLKGGGFSKSTMLSMAAEWLEQLLQGNQTLAAQLQGMGQ